MQVPAKLESECNTLYYVSVFSSQHGFWLYVGVACVVCDAQIKEIKSLSNTGFWSIACG